MSVPTFPANAIGAPCKDHSPELFFPSKDSKGGRVEIAKAVCNTGSHGRRCPYFDECLSYALNNKVEGVWAATTDKERVAIRHKHGIKAEALSFGTGPTNASAVKRMYRRGTEMAEIAERLGVTFEAVRLVVRADEERRASEGLPPRPAPNGRVNCSDCGKELGWTSLRKHRRLHCAGRAVAS